MITKSILEKVALEIPEKASDLKEAILMLIDIIDETNQGLVDLSKKRLEDKEFQKSIKIINLMEELDNAREKIVEQIVDFGVEESEDTLTDSKLVEVVSLEAENREKVDYSLYTVDNEEVHDLTENYRIKRPIAFKWQGSKIYANNFKAILLQVSNNLLEVHGDDFRDLTSNKKFMGRKNRMISPDPKDLLDPKLLNDKVTYLFTCLSSDAIVRLIRKFLEHFGYNIDDFKIYLRADYKNLHE